MHNVDRPASLFQEALHAGAHVLDHIVELEWHGSLRIVDEGDVPTGAFFPLFLKTGGVTECGRQGNELWGGQFQQRHLPGPAALRVGVEVELIHDDHVGIERIALAKGLVRQNFGGAAHDRCKRVERDIPRDHADVVRTEQLDQVEKLF